MHQKPSGGRAARTRWGSLSISPDPIAVILGMGPPEGRGRKGMGRKERDGREE